MVSVLDSAAQQQGRVSPWRSAVEALRLRGWAMHVLARGSAKTERGDGVSTLAAEPWQLFLEAERCALPLRERLAALGQLNQLSPQVRAVLDAAATEELQRVLAARRQLAMLGAVARTEGWPAVVLKGGVHA